MERTADESARPSSRLAKKARRYFPGVKVFLPASILFLLGSVANLRAQRGSAPRTASRDVASAAENKIFNGNCAGCHGLDARGGEHAPNIATNPELQRMTDTQLIHIVHDGAASGAMPAFGSILKDGEIKAVVRYLRALQGRSGEAAVAKLPGDPGAGKALFFGKAGCAQCHSVLTAGGGSGGFIAPDLTGYAAGREPAEILHAITNPSENVNARSRPAVVTLRDGQKFTGLIRNQDNFSVQLQSLDGMFHLLDRAAVASVTYDSQSLMPGDYSQRLTAAELNDLVSFLMRAAAESGAGHDDERHEDDH